MARGSLALSPRSPKQIMQVTDMDDGKICTRTTRNKGERRHEERLIEKGDRKRTRRERESKRETEREMLWGPFLRRTNFSLT